MWCLRGAALDQPVLSCRTNLPRWICRVECCVQCVEVHACNTKVQDQGISDSVQCLHIWTRTSRGVGQSAWGASGTAAAYSFDASPGACPCRRQKARSRAVLRYYRVPTGWCAIGFHPAGNAHWLKVACTRMAYAKAPCEVDPATLPELSLRCDYGSDTAAHDATVVVRTCFALQRQSGSAQAPHVRPSTWQGWPPCRRSLGALAGLFAVRLGLLLLAAALGCRHLAGGRGAG